MLKNHRNGTKEINISNLCLRTPEGEREKYGSGEIESVTTAEQMGEKGHVFRGHP